MNPKYTFDLSIAGTTESAVVHPNYAASLSLNWEKQSGEVFFRRKLGGALTFYGREYSWIIARATLSAKFIVTMYLNGTRYWKGYFFLTDCEINADDKTIVVTPQVLDQYSAILDGIEKEFDLIKLAPEIRPVKYSKRPVIQVYTAGTTSLGCFLSGMYWEQDCESETNHNKLTNTYNFHRNALIRVVTAEYRTSTGHNPMGSDLFYGKINTETSSSYTLYKQGYIGQSYFKVWSQQETVEGQSVTVYYYDICTDTNVVLYRRRSESAALDIENLVLYAYASTVQGLEAILSYTDTGIYMRAICDVLSVGGQSTSEIPAEDITSDNHNYSRVIGIDYPDAIVSSHVKTTTPTEWGLYQPGVYYAYPAGYAADVLNPIARKSWGEISLWFKYDQTIALWEVGARAEATMNDAYPLASAIAKILVQIAPDITHAETYEYSQLLYASNPIALGINAKPVIVPKSNVINSGYDQAAQKALVTLRQILDMLKNVYRCYWFIEGTKFRLEHIKYFNNGGSYSTTPGIALNIKELIQPRNGKSLNFGQNAWTYDKPDTYGQLNFSWADDVSVQFEGWPLNILNDYVDKSKVEDISIDGFTSDIDYILISPSEINKDGFVLLQPVASGNDYILPFVSVTKGSVEYILQNGYCAFAFTYRYYMWDLCAPNYEFGGTTGTASGVKKLRRQKISAPILSDIDTNQLITTNFGNGKIEKITLSLLSRAADFELTYDTEL